MSQIKILQLSTSTKKKNGEPIANNKMKVGIKTTDKAGNEVWINGFLPIGSLSWKVGDEVDLEITNDEKWGLQFKAPEGMESPTVDLMAKINELDNRLRKVEMTLTTTSATNSPQNAPQSQPEPIKEEMTQEEIDKLPF